MIIKAAWHAYITPWIKILFIFFLNRPAKTSEIRFHKFVSNGIHKRCLSHYQHLFTRISGILAAYERQKPKRFFSLVLKPYEILIQIVKRQQFFDAKQTAATSNI